MYETFPTAVPTNKMIIILITFFADFNAAAVVQAVSLVFKVVAVTMTSAVREVAALSDGGVIVPAWNGISIDSRKGRQLTDVYIWKRK